MFKTRKGKKIMKNMKKEYGAKEGKKVFYASKNKGTIKGVDKAKKKKPLSESAFEKKYADKEI